MKRYRDSVIQTVSGVLAAADRRPGTVRPYFHDEPTLRAAARARDHVLYRAERDVWPAATAEPDHGPHREWRVDRVSYPAGDLPSGELNRSTGHWNPDDQWEIFQVDRGEVVLLARLPGPGRPTELIRCGPGSRVTLLPGSWHLTYVWHGPAVVTNAYNITHGHQVGPEKYFTRPTLRCGLRRDGSRVTVFRDPTDPLQDAGAPVWRVAVDQAPRLPPLESLFAGTGRATRSVSTLEDHCARLEQRIGR